jgi:Mg/Co/Ni transporter MgtE
MAAEKIVDLITVTSSMLPTTLVDGTGLIIYFNVALFILRGTLL